MKQQTESITHLSRRRRCGLSPASSPPGRCSGPCAPAEPWGRRAWTCRPPSSRRAPWAAPPAATAWPWRRGTAARRERPATPPGAGRPARWRAWRRLRRGRRGVRVSALERPAGGWGGRGAFATAHRCKRQRSTLQMVNVICAYHPKICRGVLAYRVSSKQH